VSIYTCRWRALLYSAARTESSRTHAGSKEFAKGGDRVRPAGKVVKTPCPVRLGCCPTSERRWTKSCPKIQAKNHKAKILTQIPTQNPQQECQPKTGVRLAWLPTHSASIYPWSGMMLSSLKTNRTHLVLFGTQNRTLGPYLAAIKGILISVVCTLSAALRCSKSPSFHCFLLICHPPRPAVINVGRHSSHPQPRCAPPAAAGGPSGAGGAAALPAACEETRWTESATELASGGICPSAAVRDAELPRPPARRQDHRVPTVCACSTE
jgi:hypothetical protein